MQEFKLKVLCRRLGGLRELRGLTCGGDMDVGTLPGEGTLCLRVADS